MNPSLFAPLRESGLTTLRVTLDQQKNAFIETAREWEGEIPWQNYSQSFTYEDKLTFSPRLLGKQESLELYRRNGCEEYLLHIVDLMKQGGHMGFECLYLHHRNIGFINFMHTNRLGIRNGYHAIRSGGIRRHDHHEDELSVIIDGLNLSRAMSYKTYAGKIPFGGSKLIVCSDPISLEDLEALGFLAFAIDRSRSFTGPDMGFTPHHADVLKENFTRNITGGMKSAIGPTGGPTAEGVFAALQEAALFRWKTKDLQGRVVAIQGLGAVGNRLAELLLDHGASLIVSEVNEQLLNRFLERHKGKPIRVESSDRILTVEADIFAPCAVGGIITEEVIPHLKFEVIFGAANNQLAAVSLEEEIRLAKKLHEHGILFQVEWMHNTAGVLAGFEEWLYQESASLERLRNMSVQVCRHGTRKNLEESRLKGITPTENAYLNTQKEIYW